MSGFDIQYEWVAGVFNKGSVNYTYFCVKKRKENIYVKQKYNIK